MPNPTRFRLAIPTLVAAALLASAGQAVSVPFRTHFGGDVVGLPPGLGGPYQPTSMTVPVDSTITVVDAALGLDHQPVELFSGDGSATWLRWTLSPAVSDLGVDIRFSVSLASLYSGPVFEISGPGGVKARIHATATGQLRVTDSCGAPTVLGNYTAGTPVAVIVLFAPPSSYWILADGENDGFDDNVPVAGDSCQPGNLLFLNTYAWRTSGSDPVTVAFDDLVVAWLPIFVDDFESADTSHWTE